MVERALKVNFPGLSETLEADDLSEVEDALLRKTVLEYLSAGNSFLRETFQLHMDNIISAAGIAKQRFNAGFKGMLASDSDVGVQLIRPGHILRDTTAAETPINGWRSSLVASGAFTTSTDYWIGYGTNNTTALNVSQYLLMLVVGFQFLQGNAPTVEELLLTVGNTNFPAIVLRQAWIADNVNRVRAVRVPPILVTPRQTVLGQVYSTDGGLQELAVLGLSFGPGRYLRRQTYAAADLP